MSNEQGTADRGDQADVIAFLADPASHAGVQQVDRLETHGNLVFLAGADAWKIKRAVRFPYMDFSTLEKRRTACEREMEVNHRLAPDIYLGCVPIMCSADGKLAFGGSGEAVEWAVHMRRFDQAALLSNIAATGGIAADLAKAVADAVFDSHAGADRVGSASAGAQIADLASSIGEAIGRSNTFEVEDARRFAREVQDHARRVGALLETRARQGCVRRCHGDLHLGNIVVWQDQPTLFDAIEFDEKLATVDTLYDLAFLLMDLDSHGQRQAANIVLNRYLWRSNSDLDLRGLQALPLFLGLRAGVRAMVTVDRAAQEDRTAAEQDRQRARTYLRAALGYLAPASPQLIAVGGLSGTGKTTLAAALAPELLPAPGAIHLRSDLERKALLGVPEMTRLPADAYTPEARKAIYETLCRKARIVLASGHSVVADAVYASPEERSGIEAVATGLGLPFRGLWLTATGDTLAARVAARRNDASDAAPQVVAEQLTRDTGLLSPAWATVDAGAGANETLRRALVALGQGKLRSETAETTGEAP
jgi:aminoglycoside phosphotransferase family enzyme/predicted kinase